jgi:peptidyl-prolyl cis-trans isomerase D
MLDVMRSNAKSSLIAVIFGAIIVVFVFQFGPGSKGIRSQTQETWAAKVNGDLVTVTDFSNAYANRFRQVSQQRGGKYTTENAQQDNLKKETLKSLVDQELIAQQAPAMGISVSDESVDDHFIKSPQFQQDGKFDEKFAKNLIENGYGMSVHRFRESYKKDLLRAQVIEAVFSGAAASDDELKTAWIAENEGAAIGYVKFTAFMFRDKTAATDAEGEAWAKDHSKEIQDQYEKDLKTRWTQAAATKVQAITVTLAPSAAPEQDKAAKEKIDAAYAEVKGGKPFEDVAKASSEDSLTKEKGGDLGFVAKGSSAYGRTLEEEAAKLKVGELSGVFKDRTGYHFIKATELRAERVQPLDEVKGKIALDLLKGERARQLAKKKAEETLADVKAGKDLKELFPAKKTEPGQFDFSSFMNPQSAETEVFHPLGGYVPGVGLAPKLSSAVFSLNAGEAPAAPIEDGDTFYVFKLKSRTRADLAKFDDAAKTSTREQVESQKQRDLYTSWIERLRKNAKIVENERVLSYDASSSHESYNPDDY